MYLLSSLVSIACISTVVHVRASRESDNIYYEGARITGGRKAREGEFPFVVSVRLSLSLKMFGMVLDEVDKHICGGSVLTESWILSALHCFVRKQKNVHYYIKAGTTELSRKGPHISERDIKAIVYPSENDAETSQHDIALLNLSSPLKFDGSEGKISTIRILAEGHLLRNKLSAIGWGSFYRDGPVFEIQKVVELPLVSNKVCQMSFQFIRKVTGYMLCAGSIGGKGVCTGDSGGPLIQIVDGEPVLVGISSWSYHKCATGGYPGVFTRVSSYANWIQKTIS